MPAPAERIATYRDVFGVRDFRALFLADLLSLLGDQIAAVAVAVLLYERSGSAFLAALGYATAYVPGLLGGPILAAWAERLPGRSVMIGCDLGRAALIGLAALPGLPLAGVGLLVLVAALLAPPFEASRSARMPQILPGDRYAVAMSLRDAVHQSAQLVGFAAGGALVVVLSARGALLLDAASFVVSAAILRLGLGYEPANQAGDGRRGSLWRETVEGFAVIRRDRMLSAPLLLGIAGAAYAIVPEAIAPAYAASLGHGATGVGLIMASVAAGSVLGGLAIGRLVRPARRVRLMYPLAVLGAVPLVFVLLRPDLPVSLGLFVLTGLASSYQIAANTMFARNVPPNARARAFGIAMAGMSAGQALAIVLAGAAAQFLAPTVVVAGAGVLGVLAVLSLRLPSAAAVERPARHALQRSGGLPRPQDRGL
jgi:predicted MFS family arabinose efflux permease